MSSEPIVALLVLVGILLLLLWILRLCATLVLVFTAFMIELPLILSIPAFIIFPPAFLVFLGGLFLLWAGYVDDNGMWRFGSSPPAGEKNSNPNS